MKRISGSAVMVAGALAAAAVLFPLSAVAEIYGWVDPSGGVTYSNLPPPDNARVIEVIPDTPPPTPQQQAAAAAAHETDMRALNDRVQQLERELRASRMMEAPPYPTSYGPPPGYAAASPAPYPSYDAGPAYGTGCDPTYYDCDSWDGPVYYSTGFLPWWGYWHHGHDEFHHHHGRQPFPGTSHFAGGPVAAHSVAGHSGGHAAPSHGGGGHSR